MEAYQSQEYQNLRLGAGGRRAGCFFWLYDLTQINWITQKLDLWEEIIMLFS